MTNSMRLLERVREWVRTNSFGEKESNSGERQRVTVSSSRPPAAPSRTESSERVELTLEEKERDSTLVFWVA
jgi:hypothetical protein